ncbi:preprotein translocase subunit YajC [Rhodothalassium salexigens]|uniref:preprotein translocase subunit YajC n=1 Tax=Rhodothalassium salexigens TaxID=1086 RepID=UPI0019118FC4|nr:preprotein translocase subunit YajC [Rhodothalassium salexigens]MBK5911764.1 preprotein translocase subunit YajC [Rhodothalassium salexigens]MBK5920448.1 preprotein translocase subunit YajC [Rhodothalassium salexigens]
MFDALTILQNGASAPPQGGAGSTLVFLALFVVLLYFMIIRPQQKRAKEHRTMLENLRRGDTVVTNGGFIGKIHRINDNEVDVDLADGVRVKMLKHAISDVRSKTEPVKGNGDKPAADKSQAKKGGQRQAKGKGGQAKAPAKTEAKADTKPAPANDVDTAPDTASDSASQGDTATKGDEQPKT